MRARAAVLRQMGAPAPYASSRPLRIETIALDAPGPRELRVRVLAAGLCHSDLSVIDGSRPRPMPMVLGHEVCAEVEALGADVDGFAVGDRLVCSFVPGCGHCAPCATGRAALCEPGARANAAGVLLSGARRLRDGDARAGADAPLNHHLGVSGFAERAIISVHSAVRIDADLPPAIAALFGCAVMTGVGAIVNTARVAAGEAVAIFGLGGVGLAALLGARAVGASPIVVVDVVPEKLRLALELGASHAFDARDGDVVALIREVTGGGAHHAIESVGSAAVMAQAYAATRRGGTTVPVGLPSPSQQFSVPAVSLVAEERTIRGSYMGSAVPSRDLPRYIAMYRAGVLPVHRLLTRTLPLDEINDGFDELASGRAIRQVVVFD